MEARRVKGTGGQCTGHNQRRPKINEFSWKDVTSALSLANMVLGLFSIFCSVSRKPQCASWMLLISFLLDMAVGAMTRQLNIFCKSELSSPGAGVREPCSPDRLLCRLTYPSLGILVLAVSVLICSVCLFWVDPGTELNDFAVFTTFGLASALLLGVDGPLNGFLAIIYVLTTSFRLCFYSSGISLCYKGLPCPYASCVLASTSLLTKGNTFILCCMASLMILFMIDQSYYPYDEILESDSWKKVIYMGGVFMLFFCPFSLTAFYCLMWSLSYIFFPDALWGRTACFRL